MHSMVVLAVLPRSRAVPSPSLQGCVTLFFCLLPRLVVGVPNGTVEGGMVVRTGLVFFCPLRTSDSGECLPAGGLLYDTLANDGGGEGDFTEEKESQQMGFSMKSDSEQLVVCVRVVCGVRVVCVCVRVVCVRVVCVRVVCVRVVCVVCACGVCVWCVWCVRACACVVCVVGACVRVVCGVCVWCVVCVVCGVCACGVCVWCVRVVCACGVCGVCVRVHVWCVWWVRVSVWCVVCVCGVWCVVCGVFCVRVVYVRVVCVRVCVCGVWCVCGV